MSTADKLALIDDIFVRQPHMLAAVLVTKQLGVSLERVDSLLDILLNCHVAMYRARQDWPLVTEALQERQLTRFTATVHLVESLGHRWTSRRPPSGSRSMPRSHCLRWCGRGCTSG